MGRRPNLAGQEAETHMSIDPIAPIPFPEASPYARRPRPPIQPVFLPQLRSSDLLMMEDLQQAFDRAFPPIRSDEADVLVLRWAAIERQYLDLAAPWDLQNAAFEIRRARQMASLESPEKTIRQLFALSQDRPGFDADEPIWGKGESLPMP